MTELKFGMTEFQFGKPEFHSGSRSFIWEAEVLFGMTEFRLRQYSPIQSISVAPLPELELLPSVVTVGSNTPKLPESEFRHPVSISVAGNGVPAWDEVVLFGKPEFYLG